MASEMIAMRELTGFLFAYLCVHQFQVLPKQGSRSHQESHALLELGYSLVFSQGPEEGCSWPMAPPFPLASSNPSLEHSLSLLIDSFIFGKLGDSHLAPSCFQIKSSC